MPDGRRAPDPRRIHTPDDLKKALDTLRRRSAGQHQASVSIRTIAKQVGRSHSTVHQYLRVERIFPPELFVQVLTESLGIAKEHVRPWRDALERVAEYRAAARGRTGAAPRQRTPEGRSEGRYVLVPSMQYPEVRIGFVVGDLRDVKSARIWVNSENTDMRMSRFEECTVSAIVRHGGAVRDAAERVVRDVINDELQDRVAGLLPVLPGAAIVTGSGELRRTNEVHRVIHVAAVQGEAGEGYRQVRDIRGCVTNALAKAEECAVEEGRPDTIIFPLLGTGSGRGDPERTVQAMLEAVISHFSRAGRRIRSVTFLAHTASEIDACNRVFDQCVRIGDAPR